MPLPTNINERNAAIIHGRIVLTKSQNEYPRSAKKLIELSLSIGIKTTPPGFGWNIPTCWRSCFVFIAVSMPQYVYLYVASLKNLRALSQKHK